MGLDMYLSAKKYVSGWEHSLDPMYAKLVKLTGVKPDGGSPHFYVEANVGYWRKANAIHAWFVEHVQDGKDECQESCVSRKQLQQLRDACQQVLDSVETVEGRLDDGTTYHPDGRVEHRTRPGKVVAQPGVAARVLPTRSGFFFGGTNYDECYLADLSDTVAIIDRVLKMSDEWSFVYHASW